jgi:hypothetical protein
LFDYKLLELILFIFVGFIKTGAIKVVETMRQLVASQRIHYQVTGVLFFIFEAARDAALLQLIESTQFLSAHFFGRG